jgi:predicted RNase H-like nuclease (RuvC/YqgF family)
MKDPLVEDLKNIIRTLSKEIRDLRDENESLWLMLDEIKESDMALKKQLDASQNEALIEFLSQQAPVGEA